MGATQRAKQLVAGDVLGDLTLLAPVDGVSSKRAIEATVDHPGPIY